MTDFSKVGVPFARMMEQADLSKPVSCPSCKCEQLMFIEVAVFGGLIRGGEGTGRYFGCPACPWASPMKVISKKAKEEAEEAEEAKERGRMKTEREQAIKEHKAREIAEAHESYHDAGSYDVDVEDKWKDVKDGLSGGD